ncbi:DUF2306 domain-containing protein [Nocardiopsis metallicus]|uniref:Uncharacterized membrane protein YozB (DUF420 family) n=1 Tax=Nocardiopsis metallicus TaxID=179819 RepID=A0A840W208_9ACTN|nr:DUF2306 domain-containing protein [Nocardiopsis metallicus]MBB5490014.1 uncharacterized membrane protein YozB (DUF420 family) [Nocardiopsis metallicus]
MTTSISTRSRPVAPWWRRPWMGPLFLLVAVFLGFSVPRYLTLDPALSNLEPPPGNPVYYPILVAHVLFGAVAMITCCFQVWPRFRSRHPGGHRLTGRIYVLAGVLPAGLTGLYVGQFTPFGPSVQVANTVIALLWLAVTAIGFRMALRLRFAEHRRWMLRSFALTMSIIVSRLVSVPAIVFLAPRTETRFGGSEELMLQSATSIGVWSSLVITLVLAEWAIERGVHGRERRAPARIATEQRA